MDFILNEESLKGQFDSITQFLESLSSNTKCFTLIRQNPENNICKISDFYKCYITPGKRILDLKTEPCSDALMRFQMQLDQEIQTVPYWDENPEHDISKAYCWNGKNVSATAIAEAAKRNIPLLSFKSDLFIDCKLDVSLESDKYSVDSVYSPKYLANFFQKKFILTETNS